MKRLLVIAYAVPPTRGASPGRVGHLIRHLPAHGWEAVVLTPRHPERVVTAEKTREHRNYPIPLRLVHDGGGVPYWLQETGFQELFAGLRKAAGPPAAAEQTPGLYGKRAIDPEAQALEDPPVPKWAWQRLIVTAQSNPDHRAGWVEPGLQAARAVAQALRLDAVYSLSPPVTAHRIAMRAAENLGIPWIAEE
ncbi:MAG: hypothetical protein QUU85_00545, partial [Candidatus Eisenbacteria bacterium]|nr:hypothetical protein [Candidatus Eisenbacteria bacterium]